MAPGEGWVKNHECNQQARQTKTPTQRVKNATVKARAPHPKQKKPKKKKTQKTKKKKNSNKQTAKEFAQAQDLEKDYCRVRSTLRSWGAK